MLLLLLLILFPIALSIGLTLRPQFPLPIWYILIAVSAFIEMMVVGTSGNFPGPKQLIIASMLMIVIPWALTATYLWFMRHSSRKAIVSVGTLFAYLISMGIGVWTGDLSGLIPQ